MSARLFEPFGLKDVSLRNRVVVGPMCQYSAEDGIVGDWHLVNLGSRAIGGAGLVIAEATAVSPEGRITQGCAGLWNDEQGEAWSRVAKFVARHGAVPGIQLAHAGRKASAKRPWDDAGAHMDPAGSESWPIIGPSAAAFGGNLPVAPAEMGEAQIRDLTQKFARSAQRALDAGFQWMELHFAHGYLVNSFLSPLANQRTDQYGGSLENRSRLAREVFAAVREVWPERLPLTVRLGVDDHADGGMNLEEGIQVIGQLRDLGMDLIDVSISLNIPDVSGVPWGPGFMLEPARRIRKETGMPVGVGWMIHDAQHAESALEQGCTDLVFLARPELKDPYWPFHAAEALGHADPVSLLPVQYAAWLQRKDRG